MNTVHIPYMQRCLELASAGLGHVAPNPLVGAVIVKEDHIIGEGFHEFFGGPHAEVNAVNSVLNKENLHECRLYVNLEPCSHHGKTPPCSQMIISLGIPEVIIGSADPNPLVAGKGIDQLKASGIKVTTGILENESRWLNRRFIHFHEKKRPWVILKWAQSADGFIDVLRTPGEVPRVHWITDEAGKILVHRWRSEEQAIMTGTNTLLMDNPMLTTRLWKGKSPVRIVPDRTGRLDPGLAVFDGEARTIVITSNPDTQFGNTETIIIDAWQENPLFILNALYKKEIQSIIVEGGASVLRSFICSGLWNEARIFTGDQLFGEGVKAPVLNHAVSETRTVGNSILNLFYNKV